MVSPSCVLLAFNVGCCVLFVSEYPLESWLCRSFGLGRKALTSAFHSQSTTGHVDHSLLQNTYLRAPSSSFFHSVLTDIFLLPPLALTFLLFTSLFPFRITSIPIGNVNHDRVRSIHVSILDYVVDSYVNLETSLHSFLFPIGRRIFIFIPTDILVGEANRS